MLGVFFGPLAFGATEVWSLAVMQLLAAVATVLWLLAGPRGWRLLWIPATVAVLGLCQVVPLPDSLLGRLSPLAGEIHGQMSTQGIAAPAACVSVSPGATLTAVRQLFLLALVAVVSADLARKERVRRRLVWAVAISGCVVLLLGLLSWGMRDRTFLGLHDMRGPIKSYKSPLLSPLHGAGFGYRDRVWVGPVSYVVDSWNVGDTFGPYVVSNHFAGCMELTMPLGVALLLACRWGPRRRRLVLIGLAWMLGLVGLVAVSAGARSWGGAASLGAGLLVVAWASARAGRARKAWGATLGMFLAAWIVLFVVLRCWDAGVAAPRPDPTPATLRGVWELLGEKVNGRAGVWETASRMARHSPWLGLGLGSFADAYPHFGTTTAVMAFAHNDYVQLAAEAGIAGILLAGVVAVLAVGRVRRHWGQITSAGERGLGIGLVGSLVAFLAHGLFDWNLHVPANAWIFAVLCGTLFAVAARRTSARPLGRREPRRTMGTWAVTGVIILVLGLCVNAATGDVLADRAVLPLRRALAIQRKPRSGLSDVEKRFLLQAALPGALRGVDRCPRSAQYAETVAEAYLHLSGGRVSPELLLAEQWFRRVRRLCPVKAWVETTLVEIEQVRSQEDHSAGTHLSDRR